MKTSSKLLAAALVACGAYAATSWWLGGQVEALYTVQLERARQTLAGKLNWQRNYRRGLFSSSQDWVLEIPVADVAGPGQPPVRIRLHSDIRHGPVVGGKLVAAVDHTRVQSMENLPSELTDNVKLDGALTVTTVQALRGTWHSELNAPGGTAMLPLDGPDGSQGTVTSTWQPLHGTVRGDSSYREIDGAAQWPGLQAEVVQDGRQAALTLTDWSSRYHIKPDADAWLVAPAHFSASVSGIELTETTAGPADTATPRLALSNVDYDLNRSASASHVDITQNLSAEGQFGPVRLDRLEAEESLQQLDKQALRELQPLLVAALFSDDPDHAIDANAVKPLVRRLADAGPRYAERINATLDGTQGHLQWRLALAPNPHGDAASRLGLPLQLDLLSRLSGDADLRLPASWVPALARQVEQSGGPSAEELHAQLDALVAQGLLRNEEGAYTLQAEYANGRLSLNGQTVFGLR